MRDCFRFCVCDYEHVNPVELNIVSHKITTLKRIQTFLPLFLESQIHARVPFEYFYFIAATTLSLDFVAARWSTPPIFINSIFF